MGRITYAAAGTAALAEEMRRDPTVFGPVALLRESWFTVLRDSSTNLGNSVSEAPDDTIYNLVAHL